MISATIAASVDFSAVSSDSMACLQVFGHAVGTGEADQRDHDCPFQDWARE